MKCRYSDVMSTTARRWCCVRTRCQPRPGVFPWGVSSLPGQANLSHTAWETRGTSKLNDVAVSIHVWKKPSSHGQAESPTSTSAVSNLRFQHSCSLPGGASYARTPTNAHRSSRPTKSIHTNTSKPAGFPCFSVVCSLVCATFPR